MKGFGYIACGAILIGSLSATPTDGRDACEAREALRPQHETVNQEGTKATRNRLLSALEPVIQRNATAPTACLGELIEWKTYHLTQNSQYADALGAVDAFDALGPDVPAIDVRARMIRFRGYLLDVLGETTRSAQTYYRAATLADRLPAHTAAMTLIEASSAARTLQDFATAKVYQEAAERVLRDSIDARPDLRVRLGRVLLSKSYLILDEAEREQDSSRVARLATTLRSTADSALTFLGPPADDLDNGRRALTMGHRARADILLGDPLAARALLQQAAVLAERGRNETPRGPHSVAMWASIAAEADGDAAGAASAAEAARREAVRSQEASLEAESIERLGVLAEMQGRLDAAAALYERAISLREVARERLELQDWSASAFAAMQTPYRGLARIRVRQGRTEEGFALLDQTRARYLRDLQANTRSKAALRGVERAAVDSLLSALEAARLSVLSESVSIVTRSAAMDTIATLQRALADRLRRDEVETQTLNLGVLQGELGRSGRVLLTHLIDPHGSLAFVVTADTLVALPLATGPMEIARLLARVGSPWSGRGSDPGFDLAPLHDLYRLLVEPLASYANAGTPLVVIPDGPLNALPFGMLLTEPGRNATDARFLIRRHPISTELAASLIKGPTPQAAQTHLTDLIAFGRSTFETVPAAWTTRDGERMHDLPGIREEIRYLSQTVPQNETKLDADATERALIDALPRARVLHVASHAEANPAFPLYSRILLHDAPDDDDDGVLHLYEIQNQRVPADLVVLSGCTTAAGRLVTGEGTLGLNYAVRAAGAGATLATLWAVDDEATSTLMQTFYENLSTGLTRDRALQHAQIAYLETHDGLRASPYYWAASILSGDVEAIEFSSPPPAPAGRAALWVIPIALLALGAGVAWRRRHRPTHA